MDKLSFYQKETGCEMAFGQLTNVYHCCTPEDYEIIFTCPEEFSLGMWLLGICAKLYPQIKIYSFQLMNNHIHLILSGDRGMILEFFALFRSRLSKCLYARSRLMSLKGFNLKIIPIDNLEYFRSSVAYVNRNGFVVNDDTTPFTYPWGTNSYMFQPLLKKFYNNYRQAPTVTELRKIFHSKQADDARGLFLLNGAVSSMSFCDIQTAESVFRDAKHYFYSVSRNVESYSKIAALIGEYVCYTDDDIYSVARNFSKDKGENLSPGQLAPELKLELAVKLHHEYHAGKKQIQRILKLDSKILDSMF